MVRLTIELDDETYARLEEAAKAGQTTVAELIARSARNAPEQNAELEHVIDEMLEAYRPTFDRLAQ